MAKNLNQSERKSAPTQKVGVISENRIKREKAIEENEKRGMSGFFIFFMILIIIGVSIGILFSPTFNLESLEIKDGVNVKSAEISNAVNVQYGVNVLRQNYKEMKNAILSLPYIKSAKIKISFPNKIKIEYEEREPYSLLKYLESYYVTDAHGYLLEIKRDISEENILPIIYGIDISTYELGSQLDNTERIKYENVVTLLETAKQRDFAYNIYEINYETIAEVKIWIEGFDITIVYGDINRNLITDKLTYLSSVLERLVGKKGTLDLSSDSYLEKTIFTERYE